MDNENLPPLIALQKWKLWIWGTFFAIAGLGYLIPDRLASAFAIAPVAINLGSLVITFVAFGGALLSIRCPQCGLSLAWYGLSHKSIGGWLSWLLDVNVCPKCEFPHKSGCCNSEDQQGKA